MSSREHWYIKNISQGIISLGDLPKVPALLPNEVKDLLVYYGKTEINNSTNLITAVNKNKLRLNKVLDNVPAEITKEETPNAVTSVEKNETASGSFNTISVSGQDNVSASNNSTLTLVEGDGIVLTTDSVNNSILIESDGGGGDVVGSGYSGDNAIVRFDGTTGKVIQNSFATIDDSGNLFASNLPNGKSSVSDIQEGTNDTTYITPLGLNDSNCYAYIAPIPYQKEPVPLLVINKSDRSLIFQGNGITYNGVTLKITGLAFNPIDGILYGASGGASDYPKSLFKIDPVNGNAELIAAFSGSGSGSTRPCSDITFNSSGQMYGAAAGGGEGNIIIFLIDKGTAVRTPITSGVPCYGQGNALSFDSNDNLYFASGQTIFQLDPSNASVIRQNDFSDSYGNLTAMDFDNNGIMHGISDSVTAPTDTSIYRYQLSIIDLVTLTRSIILVPITYEPNVSLGADAIAFNKLEDNTLVGYHYPASTNNVTLYSPTTGNNLVCQSNSFDQTLYVTPSETLASLNILLPSSNTQNGAKTGQIIRVFISQIITTLTVTVQQTGIVAGNLPDTSSANSFFSYCCVYVSPDKSTCTWARI
jgi:hypothetical protein